MLRDIANFVFWTFDMFFLVLYWGFALVLFLIVARQDYILAYGMLEFGINVNQTFWYFIAGIVVVHTYFIQPWIRRFFGR